MLFKSIIKKTEEYKNLNQNLQIGENTLDNVLGF